LVGRFRSPVHSIQWQRPGAPSLGWNPTL
jgi:hypothetical protein